MIYLLTYNRSNFTYITDRVWETMRLESFVLHLLVHKLSPLGGSEVSKFSILYFSFIFYSRCSRNRQPFQWKSFKGQKLWSQKWRRCFPERSCIKPLPLCHKGWKGVFGKWLKHSQYNTHRKISQSFAKRCITGISQITKYAWLILVALLTITV